jgi:hypothetical protein
MKAALAIALLIVQQPFVRQTEADAPQQPVPYSHKQHVSMGLECATCHTNPDPGDNMGLPKVSVCMTCHASVKTDSPHIRELAKAAAEKKELRWKRVYQVPSYVYFSHRLHMEAGASCEACHGPVAQRTVIFKEGDITMGGCMSCHEQKKAPNDCNACHEPR